MEKFSPFETLPGSFSDKEKDTISKRRERDVDRFNQDLFIRNRRTGENIKEREKTPDDLKTITLINEKVNELLNKYGLPSFDVNLKNIHMFGVEKIRGGGRFGSYRGVMIFSDADDMKIQNAAYIAHEIIHSVSLNKFKLLEKSEESLADSSSKLLKQKSFGLHLNSDKKQIFGNMDEAITEELAKRICLELIEDEFFSADKEDIETILNNNSQEIKDILAATGKRKEDIVAIRSEKSYDNDFLRKMIHKIKKTRKKNLVIGFFAYPQERKILNILIDRIFEKQNEKFQSREEVFDIFARAKLVGDAKKIVQLLNHTFGNGTTQKMMKFENSIDEDGKPFNDVNGQLEFVKNL